jgi:putative PEP-CTERM system TPR-repeat lipoprotein
MALFLSLASGCSKKSPEELIAAAQAHIAEQKDSTAQIELRNAIQQAPTNGPAHRLLGSTLLRTGDPVGAEIALRKALTLGETPDAVVPGLAQSLLQQNQPKKVLDEFGSVTLQDAAAVAALKTRLGEAWLARGEIKPAAQAFASALTAQPGLASALLGQARIAAREGKPDEALALTEKALASDARSAEGHLFKGQLQQAKGQREAAVASLEKAVALDGGYLPARLGLALIYIDAKDFEKAKSVLAAAGAAKDPRVGYMNGLLAARQGDLLRAKEALAGVLKVAPDYGSALALAGEVELRSGNFGAAELHLVSAMRLQPSASVQRLLATTYLRQNRPTKSIETLQPLLQDAAPRDAGLNMLAGEAYLAVGDYRRAGEYFEASKAAGADEGAVRTSLGRLAVNEGDFTRGVEELQAASAASPQTVEPDLLLVSLHLRQRAPAKALAAANAFIKKQPQNPLGHVLAGTAQALMRDAKGARTSFESALKIKADHLPALRGLADLDVAEGKAADAQRRFEALLSARPDDDQLLVALASLQERAGRVDEAVQTLRKAITAHPQARDPVVALVQLHLRRKDPAAALAVVQEAVRYKPDEMDLVLLLGMVQEAAGANKDALRTLTALVLKEPHTTAPLMALAQLQVRQRDFDGAAKTLLRAQEKAPQNDAIARDLAAVYLQAGKVDQAVKVAKDLQAKRPEFVGGYLLEGDIWSRSKKWPEAERAYRAALKADPDGIHAAGKVYTVLVADGRRKHADGFVAEWTARHPSDLRMRMLAGEVAMRDRNFPAAIKVYEQVTQIDPNHVIALNNLAWALGENKDPRALAIAERAAELAPNSGEVLDTVGVLRLQAGDAAKGLEALERARQLQPDRLDVRLHYAKGLLQNGRTQEGKAELRELAAVKGDFPGKSDIAALLAKP